MSFSLISEKLSLVRERHSFLEKEIEHFGFVCESLKDQEDGDLFYLHGRSYSDRLLTILRDISQYEQAIDETTQQGVRNLITVESVYAMLPILCQNVNNAHTIRKHRKLRLGHPTTKPRFALSEVHPDYPQTIRAIEVVNSAYNDRLATLLEKFEFMPPILVMSRSSFWGLYGFPDEDNYFFRLEDCNIDSRKKLIDYFLFLSWISLPRWVPIQMRFSPVLAHENFHRVMQVAVFATDDLRQLHARPGGIAKEDVEYLERELYGAGIIRIMRYYHAIARGLEKFLTALRFPDAFVAGLMSSDPDTPMIDRCYWVNSEANIEISALRMANEIMSDIGALLIAGPAYVLSMLSDPGWMNKGTLLSVAPMYIVTHPPLINRIELLIKILAYYGFTEVASMCKNLLEEYLGNVNPTPRESVVVEGYRRLLLDHVEFFYEAADRLHELMPDCAGGRIKRGQLGEDDWLEEKKDTMLKALSGRFHQIDVTPEEVINTIWYKKIVHSEPSQPEGYTAWRVLLCNFLTQTQGCR